LILFLTAGFALRSAWFSQAAQTAIKKDYEKVRRDLIRASIDLGDAAAAKGDPSSAYANYTRARDLAQALWTSESAEAGKAASATRTALAETGAKIGELLAEMGSSDTSARNLKRALELYEQIAADEPSNSTAKAQVERLRMKIASH
jgi:tetratricopeptide (TPR) repeat protein